MLRHSNRLGALLAIVAVASPGTAVAQAYQCRLPQGAVSVPRPVQDGPTRKFPATGYTLALSWSPEYCRGAGAADRFQCSGGNGRFGLVLHGLWPEGRGSRWPQWCPTRLAPSPALVKQNLCMTPSAALIAHEWAKHGSCMARTPETYFKAARILWASLTLPDLDLLSKRNDLTAGGIREAMAEAFPAFRPEMVGIRLNERGWLEEIRLCYNRRFRPTRCTPAQFGPGNDTAAKIWRGL